MSWHRFQEGNAQSALWKSLEPECTICGACVLCVRSAQCAVHATMYCRYHSLSFCFVFSLRFCFIACFIHCTHKSNAPQSFQIAWCVLLFLESFFLLSSTTLACVHFRVSAYLYWLPKWPIDEKWPAKYIILFRYIEAQFLLCPFSCSLSFVVSLYLCFFAVRPIYIPADSDSQSFSKCQPKSVCVLDYP